MIPYLADLQRETLRTGLQWLHDTVQPGEAIVMHHGISAPAVDGLRFQFTRYEGRALVIADQAHPVYGPVGDVLNPLTADEVAAIRNTLSDLLDEIEPGATVDDAWNGTGCTTGSFATTMSVHPSLHDAMDRYATGCPRHFTVFCRSEDESCRWYADGYTATNRPAWPTPPPTPRPAGLADRMAYAAMFALSCTIGVVIWALLWLGVPLGEPRPEGLRAVTGTARRHAREVIR